MSDSDNDYLIQLHMGLPPYNTMPKEKAIDAIKLHCGMLLREKKKFVFDSSNDLMSECMRYAHISTVSEEEDVMSGSEEHYIEKWIKREPYNKMPRTEAEALIRSKLTIVHRNSLANSDSEKFCRKDFNISDSEVFYCGTCREPPENTGSCDSEDC